MKINLGSTEEITAARAALGCAQDNEGDKGPEGCGEEVMEEASTFLDSLEGTGEVEIGLHTLALLERYLGAIEGAAQFEDEDDPEACEAARAGLLERIERFVSEARL